jgi:hypothetical protein
MVEHCKSVVFKLSTVLESSEVVLRKAFEDRITEPGAVFLEGWILLCPIGPSEVLILLEGLETLNEEALCRRLTIP